MSPDAQRRAPSPDSPEDAVQDPFDPDLLSPEARTREVAGLLATGYLRLRELRTAARGDAAAGGGR